MTLPTVQHPEFQITSDTYLNFYSGVDSVDLPKFSHYTEMSADQKATFESFVSEADKKEWDAIRPDKFTCLRFLQADKYDSVKAMKRLIDNQAWLLKVNIPNLLSNPPAKIETYRKLRARAYMGRAVDGMPIFAERLGDFLNAIPSPEGKTLTSQDFSDCFLYDLGEVLCQVRGTYKQTCDNEELPTTWRATWIMDCKNIHFFRATKATGTIQLLDSMTEPNFPEMAGPVTIIHVPSIVMGIWRVCRAFLDATVVSKIQLHHTLPTDLLLERIPESVLFEEFGGSNTKITFPQAEYT